MSDEEEYEVENVTQARVEKEKGKKKNLIWKYNVRWKGYGPEDDTWEPVENFDGSEHMLAQFWERANTGGRDYRDLSLFRAGESFVLTGPPRRKPKKQSFKSNNTEVPQVSPGPSSSRVLESVPHTADKRRRSPSVIEIKDSDDDERPRKRIRETTDIASRKHIPLPGHNKGKAPKTSLPTNPRISPKKSARAPSYDEIIPPSDDEPVQASDLETPTRSNPSLDADAPDNLVVPTREVDMDLDDSSMLMESRPVIDTASKKPIVTLPAHRVKVANPKVKMAELDLAPHEGAISVKARLGRKVALPSSSAIGSQSADTVFRSKPGPGRSSSGFVKKNTSSLLTYQRGELKSLKGHYAKEVHEKEHPQASEALGTPESPSADPLWGGIDEEATDMYSGTTNNITPPSANELLNLAGAADTGDEHLPDFEEDGPAASQDTLQPSISTALPESHPAVESQLGSTYSVHQESLARAKNSLFPSSNPAIPNSSGPIWKQPTMFGPLGFGSNPPHTRAETSEMTSSVPFFINLDSSASIPVILTDTTPGSLSLELIVANKGPPGKFYNQKSALALLDTLRTGGSSAKVSLHTSATSDDKSHFERFRSRLSAGELYAGMAGDEFLAFCSSDDALLTQRLNIRPQLLGQPGDVFVERVVIENFSAYADAALGADTRRWSEMNS